ncbi:MAG: hypothetical protein V7K18_03560 [Nostoc sp.]
MSILLSSLVVCGVRSHDQMMAMMAIAFYFNLYLFRIGAALPK